MPDPNLDWDRLDALRQRFLATDDRVRAIPDYWRDPADLELYDAIFGARIGWKWDAVLAEIGARGIGLSGNSSSGASGDGSSGNGASGDGTSGDGASGNGASDNSAHPPLVVDWGCGTGVAARRFATWVADRHGAQPDDCRIMLHDRSAAAVAFATARLRAALPDFEVAAAPRDPTSLQPDLLLVSHVLGELDASGERELLALAARSRTILWVEAGTRAISRRLSGMRDALIDRFDVLAPCPHQLPCSALRTGEQHWCHFFTRAPAFVFMDAGWRKVGERLGIDLRALPYHFLCLRTRAVGAPPEPAVPPQSSAFCQRLIGRPEVRNKLARFFVCDAQGVRRREIFKTRDRPLYQRLRKHADTTRFIDP